ncbi:hypothetical protein ElyMa_006737600 [Elysia marginata]|uniref:Uncharacterized protein n=1 Tax=Elysia marginata TaxID=1093978 RepID=A0AAV4IY36_9GAST|nr:hypothetical protein ElyMa_006737600 [Elysia marginata]
MDMGIIIFLFCLFFYLCHALFLYPNHAHNLKLEKIKEEARHFAELPEAEFNALVLQARTFSLAPGRRSSPFTTTTTGSINSNSMSGPQHSGSGWSVSKLPTLADDTLLEHNGVEDVTGGDECCYMASPERHGVLGTDSRKSASVYACGKRTVTNHFAPQQQSKHTFTASSPKQEGYDPVRYSDSSPADGSGCFTLGKDKSYGPDSGKGVHSYVDHEDVKLNLDRVLTSSADEDSGLPPSSSSHKASSDGLINSLLSDDSQDSDEEEGDEEERQSLLHGGIKSARAGSGNSHRRPRERSLVRVTATYPNPPYDEEVALNTSTGSSEYVESPRSDAEENADGSSYSKSGVHGGVEMDILSYKETPHPAERRSPTSESIHELLFSKRNNRRLNKEVWDYSENSKRNEQDDEDDDDEDDDDDDFSRGSYHRSYDSQRGAWGGSGIVSTASGATSTSASFAVPTQVDAKIPFLGPSSASSAMMYGSAQYSYNLQPDLGSGAARKAKTKKGRSKGEYRLY